MLKSVLHKAYGGPEKAIRDIFKKAREMAPCLLILEDLDSLINDQNRSFFLNELDGLESNVRIHPRHPGAPVLYCSYHSL